MSRDRDAAESAPSDRAAHGVDPSTWLVAGGRPSGPGSPLNHPPSLASNFQAGGAHYYARSDGSDVVGGFEELVGGLEGGSAVAFASGMGACAAVFDQVPVGGTVAIPADCYQGVAQLTARGEELGRWRVERIATTDTDRWRAALGNCALVWLESPSNPLLEVADLPAICGASPDPRALIAVDNTFATPLNQRPLELGADVVVHSATKFIGGHSDLLAGVAVASNDEAAVGLRRSRTLQGASPGALETFLALRGARTLAVRLRQAEATALVLAERLSVADWVSTVRYPGLPGDPFHDVAKKVLNGFGSMLSFDLVGDAATADEFLHRLELIQVVTSLGGVESTIERRAKLAGQEHLPPTLLRLSVGIEHADDLWADLIGAAVVLTR